MLRRICNLLGLKTDSFAAADRKIILDQGDSVPADATVGYAVGGLFLHWDGVDGTALYCNEGTEASSDFNPVACLGADAIGTLKLKTASSVADAASAVLLGSGTTAAPNTSATADAKFIELRCSTTAAASSDARLFYGRFAFDGEHASAGGECVRGISVVNENIGTAHGAHFGLSFKAEAGGSECSGLGVGLRGTLQIPDIASWAPAGTYAAGMFEIYSDGTASDPAGMTELSVLRLCNSGDATGAADVDTDAFLFSIQGFTAAADTTKVVSSVSLAELPGSTVGLRVKVGATTYYIPCVAATEWN